MPRHSSGRACSHTRRRPGVLPLLRVMGLLGMAALLRHCDWPLVRRLPPFGLLGTVVDTATTFGLLPSHVVAGLVGALTLAFLAIRVTRPSPPRRHAPR